jgi:hypothetical protein
LLEEAGREAQQGFHNIFRAKGVPRNETVSFIYLVKKDSRSFRSRVSSAAKTLGERRDALLLAAGALYLLGYLSWATYGLLNQVGFIPVLDTQYFAAGIVPALLIFLFIAILRLLRLWNTWMEYPPTKVQLFLSRVLLIVTILIAVIYVRPVPKEQPKWTHLWPWIAVGFGFYFWAVIARNRGLRPLQTGAISIVRSYSLFALFLWFVYVDWVMPKLPPEWGGARSRCVLLDIDSEQMSLETRSRILAETIGTGQKIRRTVPLNLIFEGNEYFFLTEQSGKPSKENPVYRLRKDAVKAMFPCVISEPFAPKPSPSG